jgi:hypothetical protein
MRASVGQCMTSKADRPASNTTSRLLSSFGMGGMLVTRIEEGTTHDRGRNVKDRSDDFGIA